MAELNELTSAAARWKVEERNDDGLILATVNCFNQSFEGFGHNKRMAKNVAAKEALDRKTFYLLFANIEKSCFSLNFW